MAVNQKRAVNSKARLRGTSQATMSSSTYCKGFYGTKSRTQQVSNLSDNKNQVQIWITQGVKKLNPMDSFVQI